jgi:hypothetical protein
LAPTHPSLILPLSSHPAPSTKLSDLASGPVTLGQEGAKGQTVNILGFGYVSRLLNSAVVP